MDRGGWEFLQGPISCHAWMMSPMIVLLCINRAGTGLTCMLSRLLNILGERAHQEPVWFVDWLHSKPELIYIYL